MPGHEVSLAAISPRLYSAVENDLGARIWPQLQEQWPLVDYHGLRDAFVIRYALGEQESLRIHHDVAQVSGSIKLNDGYEGGVLEFPRQGIDNRGMAVGELLAWPSLVTHPHRTNDLVAGVKYGLTIWFELPSFLRAVRRGPLRAVRHGRGRGPTISLAATVSRSLVPHAAPSLHPRRRRDRAQRGRSRRVLHGGDRIAGIGCRRGGPPPRRPCPWSRPR